MRSASFAFGLAMLLAAVLTPLVRHVALRVGAVDSPSARRVHERRIPRLGGLAVVVAFFVPLGVLFLLDSSLAGVLFQDPVRFGGILAGSVIVAALGAMDDIRGVGAWQKLVVQCLAAGIAFACGLRIDAVSLPGFGALPMGIFALPITVLWIVAVINAMNLIDGLDGLAGGVAFFVCITNFVVGLLNDANLVFLCSACLGGAIVGFLLYNWNPATIFMGDSGSMFLGFVLATISMLGASVKSTTTVALLVPLVALGLPIMDTLFAMVRRYLERRPIFAPDNGHIHHRLLALGLTHKRAVLILYGVCVVLTLGAIAISLGRSWQVGGAILVLSVLVFGVLRFARYFEQARIGRDSVERLHTPELERLRRAVPDALLAIGHADSDAALRSALSAFATAAGLLEMRVWEAEALLSEFEWRAPAAGATRSARETDSTNVKLPALGTRARFQVVWPAMETASAKPQVAVLLQLIGDQCEARAVALRQAAAAPARLAEEPAREAAGPAAAE